MRALAISDTHFAPGPGATCSPRGSSSSAWRYVRYACPGTGILIDEDEPQPRLLEMLADLNPLGGGPGLPAPPS